MPFISGTRRCSGQSFAVASLQVFISVLVRGYDWEMSDPSEKWTVFPAPRPENGLLVAKFVDRKVQRQ